MTVRGVGVTLGRNDRGGSMGRIIVNTNLTLDGVMQAPGRAEEDTREGFEHGGWGQPYFDEVMGQKAAEGMAGTDAFLFGRRTYEDFASVWPNMPEDNPFATVLNERPKYVVSTTLREPLPWANSSLLEGDLGETVAALRDRTGNDIVILGSGELVRSLMERDLVERYVLWIHPLVLGSGRRLFTDGLSTASLRLVDTTTTTTGVVIATYEPA
jgi:dihydrofolate reductase